MFVDNYCYSWISTIISLKSFHCHRDLFIFLFLLSLQLTTIPNNFILLHYFPYPLWLAKCLFAKKDLIAAMGIIIGNSHSLLIHNPLFQSLSCCIRKPASLVSILIIQVPLSVTAKPSLPTILSKPLDAWIKTLCNLQLNPCARWIPHVMSSHLVWCHHISCDVTWCGRINQLSFTQNHEITILKVAI